MNYLIMFCGVPGSGKSTEARHMARSLAARGLTVKHISRDELRFSIISDESEYFSKEKEVFSKFVEKMNNSLNKNDCTIIDATHISKAVEQKSCGGLKALTACGCWFSTLLLLLMYVYSKTTSALVKNESHMR